MKEETVLRKEKYAVMYMYNLYKDAHNRIYMYMYIVCTCLCACEVYVHVSMDG